MEISMYTNTDDNEKSNEVKNEKPETNEIKEHNGPHDPGQLFD